MKTIKNFPGSRLSIFHIYQTQTDKRQNAQGKVFAVCYSCFRRINPTHTQKLKTALDFLENRKTGIEMDDMEAKKLKK